MTFHLRDRVRIYNSRYPNRFTGMIAALGTKNCAIAIEFDEPHAIQTSHGDTFIVPVLSLKRAKHGRDIRTIPAIEPYDVFLDMAGDIWAVSKEPRKT